MMTRVAAIGLCLSVCLPPCWALSYVESSSGLETPALEGGRTELEFCDLNEDGNPDIVSIGDHGNPYIGTDEHGIMVWFGDGQGGWSVYQEGDFGYGGIAAGDVNNDGHLDIGCGMHHNYADSGQLGTRLIEVALGNGTGQNWVAWDSGLAEHGETYGMFGTDLADFNNDGWLDLVSNSFGGTAGVHAYLNLHDGHWDQSFGFTGGIAGNEVVLGDVNGDGNPDLVANHEYGSAYFGDGVGDFTLTQRNLPDPGSGRCDCRGISLGDIDNDGVKEFAFVQDETLCLYKWYPERDSWVSMVGNLPRTGWEATQLADMDCDGNVDLALFGAHVAEVWLGDGTGSWVLASTFTTPTPGYFEALRVGGDVDHNGYPDIALVADEADRNHLRCFREASVPESLRITPAFPRGSERFFAGSVQFVDWVCAVPATETAVVRLELSTTGPGGPWSAVADSQRNSGRFQWTVPDEPSAQCYIRYTASSANGSDAATAPRPFTILPPTAISEAATGPGTGRVTARVVPNPAQARARLEYDLPVACRVSVTLCDRAGRVVARLYRGTKPQGRHSLSVDTRGLASGAYFVRLVAGTAVSVRQLVIP
jgi:hypothetical protein